MSVDLIPADVRAMWEVHEWKHACAILAADFPNEWRDLIALLREFRLRRSWITVGGGNRSLVSRAIDGFLYDRGWSERQFATLVRVDAVEFPSPTHKVDCFKNRVALEIEWNNKNPFFDRDLNNFRLLFDLRAASVGIIITRADELRTIFSALGRAASFGESTTHMGKLLPRVLGGGGGGCPLLVLGITRALYVDDE
ncbi:MAG: hypothetical protein JO290_10305 [Sphingomonadaceae bacterium]|nr:hypothetical protein [Sphingomonadaceae bacterium]